MKRIIFRLTAEIRAVALSTLALGVACAAKAEDVSPPASGSGAVVINIHEDSTLMVSSDVEYGSLAVTGSGKLTLAGSSRIATSSVTVSSGVALVVNGRLDSTSIAVASGGAVDLVNSRDAHSLSIAGTGINNSGAVYCSESDIVDENNSPFVTNITLAADATVNADFAWGIIAQNDDKAYLNLGTNKLTIKGTNSFLMSRTEVHGSGAIEIADGAALKPVKVSPNSIFDATCTIKSGGRLDVAKTATFKDLVCEEGGGISVSPENNLCIRDQGTMTVRGTVDVRGNLYLGTSDNNTANLEVGGAVNVHNGGELGVSGRGYIKQIPGTQGKVNISNSGRVIYENCDDPWMAEYGDVFAGTGELAFKTEEQITHTITNSDFAGVVKFSSSTYDDACNILGGSEGAMFSGAPELVSGGKIHFGEWYDAEGRVFCVRNLSGSGTFDADREPTETPWTHTIETTQTTNSTFHGKFTGSTCRFDLVVNGAEELHALTLAGENTTSGILTITNNAKVVFSTTGNWTNGMVVVAEGGHLESRNAASVASALQLHAGSTLKIATTKTGNITNAIPVAVGLLQLPDEGNATIDISDIPDLEAGASQTLIACPSVAADADLSHLSVTGKTGCRLKAVAGGIAVMRRPDTLAWSDGHWNVDPEDMQGYSEAAIVLSVGANVVELPVDASFERVTVSAAAAATMCFSNHTATVGQLVLGENVTFVNNDKLAAVAISMSSNSVFTVAQSTAYSGAISGEGAVTVADGGVLMVTNTTSVAATLQLQSGSTLKIAVNVENNVANAIPVAVGSLVLPEDGSVTIDISDIPELEVGVARTLIACPAVAADADLSHLAVTGKTGCRLKAVAGGIAVELRPDALVWADGSWNVAPDEMSLYGEASIVLSGGTNTVAVPGAVAFDRVSVTATTNATLIVTGAVATVANLILNTNVTFVAPHDWDVDTVLVDAGASISAESDAEVAENLVLVHGSTVYRGAHVVGATWLAVISNAANFEASPSKSPKMLFGSGKVNGVVIRNTTGQQPSGNFQVLNGRWSVTYARPDASVLILEPDAEPGSGAMTITEEGASFSRASWTAPSGEVHSYESAQDAADAAEGKGGKVTVHASGESISLGSGWFASGVSIVVPAGVIGVTVSAAGVVLGGKDSGDGGSREYDEEEEARAEVVENGKKYASLSLAKSNMGNTPCTFRLLAESADSIHLASASDVSGQTLLLNNFPYAGTVTGAAANLARAASVTAYYAILADAKGAWTEGDTINLLSDDARYSVPAGKTLILDGEKTYAVAKPFDLTGTLTVGGCTFTASAGININAGTLKAAKANCTLIGSGTEVTLREGGVRVDTDGYSAVIAATLTVAGGLSNKPVIFKAGLADLRLSGGVSGSSVITIQSGCGKVYAPTSSNCEPGDYTQISEQDAQWATFENGIAVANLVKADGSSTAYSSMNAAGAAAQLNPTYRYIEVLVNNQTLRCLPTMGVIRVKYDNAVFVFKVQSLAQDWTFDEVYGVAFSVFTPVHKATDYVWDGGQDGEWDAMGNWKINMALEYDLPIATRIPDTNDTVTIRADGMPEAGWSASIGSSGGACKEIKVEEGAKLTLSYTSLGCDIAKTGPGTIVVTNAWTSGTPTITIEEDGGQVTLPKSAAYTLGTNTVVVSNAEDTVTLGFGVPIADPYAAWAAENGIAGAWNEMDEGGIYNVFRYLFDEPTGDIRIIDISFDAEGNVVITTPPVKNPEGFAVSVVESSDVAGAAVTRRKPLDATGRTEFSMGSAASRFYRLSATDGDAEPDLGGVQLWENGPYWAECNLGASEPEEHGYYFWWGDTVGYTRSGGTWYSFGFYTSVTWVPSTGEQMGGSPFSPSSCPTYGKDDSELLAAGYVDSIGNLAPEHDAATAHLGAPWRMPTDAEFAALTNNCTATWTTTNGVRGCLVTGKGAYVDRSIFLPTAGYGSDSTLGSPNSQGYYWSSTPDPADSHYAWHLYFNSDNFRQYIFYGRQYGLSVRPVRDAD